MFRLPLFPLNTVLFPGTPITLHIFEPRYKEMINKCLDERTPFGVVLIKRGREANGPLAEAMMVGCTARIVQVRRMAEGKMNIMAVGEDRFEIVEFDQSAPYLQGLVNLLPLDPAATIPVQQAGDELRPLMNTYLDLLLKANLIEGNPFTLPDDDISLAYTGAALLQIAPRQKQILLEAESGFDLLGQLLKYYHREIALADVLLDPPDLKEGLAGRLN